MVARLEPVQVQAGLRDRPWSGTRAPLFSLGCCKRESSKINKKEDFKGS